MTSIRKYRQEAGFSQEELAIRMSVGQSAVAQWETGARRPKVENLLQMAQLFGCSIDDLLK